MSVSAVAAAPSSAAAPAPAAPAPSGPEVRHGSCRLLVQINSSIYALRPLPRVRVGRSVACGWRLRQVHGPRVGACYAVVRAEGKTTCTCPDATRNGATCKHVSALVAAGLLPRKGVPRG